MATQTQTPLAKLEDRIARLEVSLKRVEAALKLPPSKFDGGEF